MTLRVVGDDYSPAAPPPEPPLAALSARPGGQPDHAAGA